MSKNGAKVGIATFHWADDYGAMLQTYGLKRTIENLGYRAEVIPYAPYKCVGRYWIIPYIPNNGSSSISLETLFKCIFHGSKYNIKHLMTYLGRRSAMKSFRHKYLTKSLPISDVKRISLDKYSIVFVGSDQVWNPKLTLGFDMLYMGEVEHSSNCKFVSYAASFGGSSLDKVFSEDFSKYVKNFDKVSLREKSAIPYVAEYTSKAVYNVIDPTLLNDAKIWDKVMKRPDEKEYILLYHTAYVPQMEEYAKLLAVKTGKRVIRLGSSMHQTSDQYEAFDFRPSAGPCEFVGYFHEAAYVVTNSFHGTVFATLFEKPFVVFGYEGRNARMVDLLESIGLADRFISNEKSINVKSIDVPIDWENVREKLAVLRTESIEYIKESLQ